MNRSTSSRPTETGASSITIVSIELTAFKNPMAMLRSRGSIDSRKLLMSGQLGGPLRSTVRSCSPSIQLRAEPHKQEA